jgi:hypothetical protein
MEETRIQSVAKTLLQVCITILPIGAGASSFISQQEYSLPILTALGFVWLGLIAISYCSFLLLKVLQFERGSPEQNENNKDTFDNGVRIFVLGTLFLVLSPLGFALDQIAPPDHITMNLSSSTLVVERDETTTLSRDIILTVTNIEERDIAQTYFQVRSLRNGCISTGKISEILPMEKNDAWITSWRVTIQPTCPIGDELLQFKILKRGEMIGQTNLIVSIDP